MSDGVQRVNSKLVRKVANIRESVNGERTVAPGLGFSSLPTYMSLCCTAVIKQQLTAPVGL